MFSSIKISLLALVFFLSGCATFGNLPMWPPTKVAIHFNKLYTAPPQGPTHSKEKYKEFIQDIFRRLFSEVEIVEKIEDIEYLRFLELGIEIKTLKMSKMSLAVDTPEDVIKAKQLIKELNLN